MAKFEVLWGTQMSERYCFATSRTRTAWSRCPGGTRSPTGINPASGLSYAGLRRLSCAPCKGFESHRNCKRSTREANDVRLGASAAAGEPRESPIIFCKKTEG